MSANLAEVTRPAQPPLFVERPDELWEFRGETYEDHIDCWQDVDGQVQKDKWKLGAIAASLNTKYKDKTIDRFAHEARRSARRIREYAQTWRAFENGGYAPILSFSHHIAAARADDPVAAITKAHDGEWSVFELEKWIKTGEEPNQEKVKHHNLKLSPELQKIHDDAVAAELDGRIAIVKSWTEPVAPVLSTVYQRIQEMLEWQRSRTLEGDCTAIMQMFLAEEGTEGVYTASKEFISSWLYGRGFIMDVTDLTERIELMLKVKMLEDESREGSRGATQRGSIPGVYAAHRGYMADMDEFSRLTGSVRTNAIHSNWITRLTRYAPELPLKSSAG